MALNAAAAAAPWRKLRRSVGCSFGWWEFDEFGMVILRTRGLARSKKEELYDHFKYRAKNFLGRAKVVPESFAEATAKETAGTR